mmetsp:Transcript_35845/g.36308  ORF Transcript_35845/g.36308 Transcript_35845/m.36308 type:complete len:102 (-) Transcript_35845:55-360(-)
MIATPNHGEAYTITPIVTMIWVKQKRTKSIVFESSISIVYISAENRANILPIGVVSKKLCGARKMECIKFECKLSEALIPKRTNETVRINVKTPTSIARKA